MSARAPAASKTVKSLSRAPVEVTVIDRPDHHCFQPLLYQVATAALSPADVAWPIRHILRKQKNATVLMAEVPAPLILANGFVQIDSMTIPYDYLVLATGATHSYLDHDEWREVAPACRRGLEDATRIQAATSLIAFSSARSLPPTRRTPPPRIGNSGIRSPASPAAARAQQAASRPPRQ